MLAVLAALHHRARSGEGQHIELAQGEAALCAAAEAIIERGWSGREPGPAGNAHRRLAPHGFYPTEGDDRWIAIACGSDEEWRALAAALGRADWLERADLARAAGRRAARVELDRGLAEWTRGHEAWALGERLQAAGVAALPAMHTLDVVADRHHGERRRHFELPLEFPAGELLGGSAWHLSASPPRLRWPAPAVGEHNAELLGGQLPLVEAEQRRLAEAGVLA